MTGLQPCSITHQRQISSYHRLVRRVNRVLTTPRAKVERQADLAPEPEDRPEDWERLMDEIRETDGVAMTCRDDGTVHVRWLGAEH